MEALMGMYTAVGDQESVKKINEELETLERDRAQEYLDKRELMKNQVHCPASHLKSLQEEA